MGTTPVSAMLPSSITPSTTHSRPFMSRPTQEVPARCCQDLEERSPTFATKTSISTTRFGGQFILDLSSRNNQVVLAQAACSTQLVDVRPSLLLQLLISLSRMSNNTTTFF